MATPQFTDADIKGFVDQILASDLSDLEKQNKVFDTANEFGISMDRLSSATGFSTESIQEALNVSNRQISGSTQAEFTDTEVLDYLRGVVESDLTDTEKQNQIVNTANEFGIDINRLSDVTGSSVDEIQGLFSSAGAQLEGATTPQFTDADIKGFVDEVLASDLTDLEKQNRIFDAANEFGIDMNRLASATGIPQEAIQAALNQSNQQVAGSTPAFGLAPAEEALLQGAQLGLDQIGATQQQVSDLFGQGRQDVTQGIEQGLGQLAGTQQQVADIFGQGVQAIDAATLQGLQQIGRTEGQLTDIFGQAQQAVGAGSQQGLGQVAGTQQQVGDIFGQGTAGLQPFIEPGQQASQQQAALSGALGPEAQAAAFQAFQQSPGQAFLLEEAERASLRNAAATGGLGGGNVQQELQRQAIGFAAQDFQNQFANLGEVAQRGVGAAGDVAALGGQQAGIQASLGQFGAGIPLQEAELLAGLGGQQAGLQTQLGQFGAGLTADQSQAIAALQGQQAGVQAGLGQFGAGISTEQGQALAALGGQQAGVQAGLGQFGAGLSAEQAQLLSSLQGQQAGLQTGLGQFGAGIPVGTAGTIADFRVQAGRDIAGDISGTTSALADLAAQQGAGTADILGAGAINVNNIIQQLSQSNALSQENLAIALANLGTQSGSQVSGIPIIAPQTTNTLGDIAQIAGGVGGLLSANP